MGIIQKYDEILYPRASSHTNNKSRFENNKLKYSTT